MAERRLAAIMFTDIVGYTALMAQSEQRGLAAREQHRAVVGPLAAQYAGQIVDENGDELVLSFPSALDAVSCALAVQAELGADAELKLRVGIHLGDVVFEGGRVYGDGVNVASRIRPLAEPGGICVSEQVYDSVKNQPNIEATSLGEKELNNVPRAVEVFSLSGTPVNRAPARPAPRHHPPRTPFAVAGGLVVALAALVVLGALVGYFAWWNAWKPSAESTASDAPRAVGEMANVPDFRGRPAIAVLPFDNLSPDPDQAFFAEGLAEDLITRLSAWRAFPVIARNSSFQYRAGSADLRHISDELGIRYVVAGSVRRGGDRIRVTAQLIDATSGEQVWAETYDREVADVFALQDEISSTIAASLVGDLTRAEGERARQQGTENLEAWSLYQLGLQHIDRYTREDWVEGARLFERAAEVDPRFATALAQQALANWMVITGDGRTATAEEVSAALATARRALDLDPRDPIAHAALGAVYLTAGDPDNALDSTRRAVMLNPSMPEAWIWYGFAQLLAGDPEACIVATERARRLNPQGPMVWIYDSLALANWEIGRYEASLEAGRRLVAAEPTYFTGYLYIAMSATSLGRIDEARAALAEGRRVRPDLSIELMQNYLAVSRPEIDARRNAALREAGLE